MATMKNHKHSSSQVMTVSVVGMTSSHMGDSGDGAGKSCLCNRFVWPHADHYYTNHPYIVNVSEFGNSVINNCHFLYWGEKTSGLEDGSEVCFRVIEQTEFVEDMSLKPFAAQKPYHKRISQLRLQSGGKVTYVEPNQLTLPDEFPDVRHFPDRGVVVDGFLLCVDASIPFTPSSMQHEIFTRLTTSLMALKKVPFVVVCTKCDIATAGNMAAIHDAVEKLKRGPPCVEISSHMGVNVDLCFLLLAHLIDSRKPRSRNVSFDEAKQTVDQRVKKNEYAFSDLLDTQLTDFDMPIEQAIEKVVNKAEWQGVAQLKGADRCRKLVQMKLGQLQMATVKKQQKLFTDLLPDYLSNVLPDVELDDTLDTCTAKIRDHPRFSECFVDVKRWEEDRDFLALGSKQIPFSFVSKGEGKGVLDNYMRQKQQLLKEKRAMDRIKQSLYNTDSLLPGVKVNDVMEQLGLTEEASLLSNERLQRIYQERMQIIELQCSNDIHEMLLEHLPDLFLGHTPNPRELTKELQNEPRFKRMEQAPTQRNGVLVKHISFLEVLEKGPYYTPSVIPELERLTPKMEVLRSRGSGKWVTDLNGPCFNLALLCLDQQPADILYTDIKNVCSVGDRYTWSDGKDRQMRIKCFHGDVETLTSDKFAPHCGVLIAQSLEGMEWLEKLTGKLVLPPSPSSCPDYRGFPLVLLVVDDEIMDGQSNSELYSRGKKLAIQLQCVLVGSRPSGLPGRLIDQDTVNNILLSIFDSVTTAQSFLEDEPTLESDGLNIGFFALPDDPYDAGKMAGVLASQQLVHYSSKGRTLFIKTGIERQHKIASLSFYSTINANDFLSHPQLGFVIVYSADRPASLAAVKWLQPRLQSIPVLLVAMASDNSLPLVEEGEKVSRMMSRAEFVVCSGGTFNLTHLVEFYTTCFFSRFSSWKAQKSLISEKVYDTLFRNKQRQGLPNRPLPAIRPGNPPVPQPVSHSLEEYTSITAAATTGSMQHSHSRHSVAYPIGETEHFLSPAHSQSCYFGENFTLPRSPARSKYNQPPPAPVEDDPCYSSPADIAVTSPSRGSYKSRNIRSTPALHQNHASSLTPPPPESCIPHAHPEEYAVVPSADTIGKLDTLKANRRSGTAIKLSPSHEPPSEPAPLPPDSPDVDAPEELLYASVRTTPPIAHKIMPAKKRAYDHLKGQSPNSSPPPPIPPQPSPYDHLTPRTRRRLIELGRIQQEGNGLAEYSLVGEEQEGPDAYYSTTADSAHHMTPPPTTPPIPRTVPVKFDSLPRMSRPAVPPKPSEVNRPPPPPPLDADDDMDIYSIPDMHNPVGLKATSSLKRSEVSPSAPSGISHVMAGADPDAIYALPEKRTTPPTAARRLVRVSVGDEENLYTQPSRKKTPPATFAKPRPVRSPDPYSFSAYDEEEDENEDDVEAPPLPPRNFDWSDIEDNDDEILQSDDELEPSTKPSKPNPAFFGQYVTAGAVIDESMVMSEYSMVTAEEEAQLSSSMYASVGNVAAGASASSDKNVRASTAVDEMEAVYMNLTMLRAKLNISTTESSAESIYDTLDKVVKESKNHTFPKGQMTAPVMPPLTKNALKLMKKMEKAAQKEADRRRKQEAKTRKKDEEERRKIEKAKRKGKKYEKKITRKRYFKSSLSAVAEEDGIPAFVKICVKIVEEQGIQSEGVYRLSGKQEDIMNLQEKYDQDPTIDLANMNLCVNAVTSTFKAFFKLLPEPLIPDTVLPLLLDIPGANLATQKSKMHGVLSALPRENLCTLHFLALHLNRVQKEEAHNKMSASNLAIVFWPTLMRPPLMDLADKSKQLGWQLSMARMIEHPDFIPEIL